MSFSEYRGSEEFLLAETYTVAGVTYDRISGRPIDFRSEYTGPQNALVGQITADNGEEYGVYCDYLQNNTQVQDSSGNVIYEGFTQASEGQFSDGVNSSTLSSDDIANVQGTIQGAVDSGNIYDPT